MGVVDEMDVEGGLEGRIQIGRRADADQCRGHILSGVFLRADRHSLLAVSRRNPCEDLLIRRVRTLQLILDRCQAAMCLEDVDKGVSAAESFVESVLKAGEIDLRADRQ